MLKITAHEPEEELLSGEDALKDAEESKRRWQEWERKHQWKFVYTELPRSEYYLLENLAQRQDRTVPQVIQALLDGVLTALTIVRKNRMNPKITPHEPEEKLVSSVEEAFRDAEESEKRWQEWERKHQQKFVSIGLPLSEYSILEDLAQQQGKTVPQVIQALLDGVLSALMPYRKVVSNE